MCVPFDTFSQLRKMRFESMIAGFSLDMFALVIDKVCLQNLSPVLQATICHIPRSGNKYTSTRLMKFRCVPGSRVRSVVAAKTMEVGALGPAVSSYTRVVPQGSPCTPDYTRVAPLIHCWWSSNTGATS